MTETTDRDQTGRLERFLPGAVLLGVGMVILATSWTYPRGTLSDMGPGYIPTVIGALIGVFSVAILLGDLLRADPERAAPIHWRGLIFVSAAILAFAGLIEPAGLVPSMFVATALSIFADDKARLPGVLVYAALATLAGWLLFLVALDLPIPAFRR